MGQGDAQQCTPAMGQFVDAEPRAAVASPSPRPSPAARPAGAVTASLAEDTASPGSDSSGQSPPSQAAAEERDQKQEQEQEQGLGTANNDGLLDVCPMALEFLSPAEIARLLALCRPLSEAGRAVLPSVLAGELRPRLPTDLAGRIDASPHRNEQWTKLAKEWRRESFVRADGGDEDEDDATDEDDDGGDTADTDTVLNAFLSKPKVVECLVDGCDPPAFASWLLGRDGYRGLADISHCLNGACMAGTFEDETDEEGPYVTLTQSGLADGVGVLPDKYHDFAGLVFRAIEGHYEYYICVEITGPGGQTLCYPDGTPLMMWIDAEGKYTYWFISTHAMLHLFPLARTNNNMPTLLRNSTF